MNVSLINLMQNFIFLSRITFLVAVINSANLHAEKNTAIEQTDDGFLNNKTSSTLDDYKVDSKINSWSKYYRHLR